MHPSDTPSRITEIYGDDMRTELIEIVLDALQRQGFPSMTRQSVVADPAHRAAFIGLLEDCRPMPIVVRLRDDVKAGRL
jgi:nitrogen regulatory protein PII